MNNIQRGDVTLFRVLWLVKLQFARHTLKVANAEGGRGCPRIAKRLSWMEAWELSTEATKEQRRGTQPSKLTEGPVLFHSS